MASAGTLASAWRSFVALGMGNYGAMAIGLAVNVLLARRLGTEHYGRLAFMLTASQLLLLLAVNWTHAGFVRFGSQEFASSASIGRTLWTRLGLLAPAVVIAALTVVLGRRPLADYLDIPEIGVWLMLVHFVAASGLSIVGAVLQAAGQMTRYGVCLLFDKAIVLLCLVALPAAWISGPVSALVCYAASSLVVVIWGLSVVGIGAVRFAFPPRSAYRDLAYFSAPLLISGWAGLFGANWFDLVILKWYVPMGGIGVYSLTTQLAGAAQQVTIVFSTLLLPRLSVMVAERRDADIKLFVERMLPYWLLGTSVLFSVVVLAARIGVPLVFGEAFGGVAPVLALLMVAAGTMALFNACAPVIVAYGSTWTLTGICFTGSLANVLFDLILIPRFGVMGSALATVLAYGTSASLVLIFVQRSVGGRVLRLGWLGAPVVVTCACFLLVDSAWMYPVAVTAVSLTVLALIGTFRLFRNEDAVFLKGLQLMPRFGLGPAAPAGRSA